MTRALLAVALVAAVLPRASSAQALEDDTRTSQDGVYTAEQAAEGARIYQRACSGCHAKTQYTGEMMAGWQGAPLYSLWSILTTTMPQDNPGSLSRSEYVDVLAYILELNQMPPGDEELSSRSSVLRSILFWRDES